MKNNKMFLSLLVAICLCGVDANANINITKQNSQQNKMQEQLEEIKEELVILQRRMYNQSKDSELFVNVTRLDEMVRKTAGRLDEMEYKIRQLDSKIEMINKDIDVRMSLLEGKDITQNATSQQVKEEEKFEPVTAKFAPKSLTGESVASQELAPIKQPSVQDIYKNGLEALKAKKYDLSQKSFNKILDKHSSDKLAGNAQYWLGESFYAQAKFEEAAVAFAKGYQGYENSAKKADSLLKLGMSMLSLGKNEEACAAFVSLPIEFPKAEKNLIDKANKEAKNLGCK